MKRTFPAMLLALAILAPQLSAGPPLICHPFETGDLELLPWKGGSNWNSPSPNYPVAKLVEDTLRLLSPKMPVIGRMETMRRAAIYASSNVAVGHELLARLMGRAMHEDADGLAWFDAGYLVETFRQLGWMHKNRLAEGLDGRQWIARSARAGVEAGAVEYALALMTEGAWPNEHVRKAKASAKPGSLLAINLARHESGK